MHNAIDASPEGGQVSVDCELSEDRVRITIDNQGPMILEYAVLKVFEPFFTAKSGGTGLGLSIAKKIAERHGVSLRLEQNNKDNIRFAIC